MFNDRDVDDWWRCFGFKFLRSAVCVCVCWKFLFLAFLRDTKWYSRIFSFSHNSISLIINNEYILVFPNNLVENVNELSRKCFVWKPISGQKLINDAFVNHNYEMKGQNDIHNWNKS